MNRLFAIAFVPIVAALLSACETTGDPRQGGLFGWSETKAKERQADRQAKVDAAEAQLAGERQQGAQIAARKNQSEQRLAKAADAEQRIAAKLRFHEASVRAKLDLLEKESPTPATASRARRLRAEAEAISNDRSLNPETRARKLGELESQVDAARASLGR